MVVSVRLTTQNAFMLIIRCYRLCGFEQLGIKVRCTFMRNEQTKFVYSGTCDIVVRSVFNSILGEFLELAWGAQNFFVINRSISFKCAFNDMKSACSFNSHTVHQR